MLLLLPMLLFWLLDFVPLGTDSSRRVERAAPDDDSDRGKTAVPVDRTGARRELHRVERAVPPRPPANRDPEPVPSAAQTAPPTSETTCNDVSAIGRCAGNVATACVGDQQVTIDCAASGRRCAVTREGVRCLERTALDCDSDDAPSCDGDALRHCVDGRWQVVDCAKRLGRCDRGSPARCVGTQTPRTVAGDGVEERCDGSDQDRDGRIDEGQVCDKVALVAFVAGSTPAGFAEQLEHELATLNRVYAPLRFEWAKTVPLGGAGAFNPDALDEVASQLARAESRFEREALRAASSPQPASSPESNRGLDFYVPVLFVEAIATEPPSAGVSTLPNASCGGVRISDRAAPPEGLVVLSAARRRETLAHELGHYLGLCHTHDEITAYGVDATSLPECAVSGDGLCDTPWDPGPEQCALLDDCGTLCASAPAAPDTSNVMSYYMPCRTGLSAQQLAIVERGLALRRGWFRCFNPARCPCTIGGSEPECPAAMSCQPTAEGAAAACLIDGASLPGAPCDDGSDCSLGAICLGAGARQRARCTRPCQDGCTCADVGLPFRVCAEDLAPEVGTGSAHN